ncbi:response regulator [Chitinivorax sp. B]|uniref:response regulator n=1 Tax=Chitinivorax sp. B TaxID=2502235 RepID=UPI0010F9745E|nr:response regulator [Chitinivorax sp. B]
MAKDPFRFFRIEARELVDQLTSNVIALEGAAGDGELLPKLLRLAHTLKGAARVVKQPAIADQAHAIEDELTPFRGSVQTIPREQVDRILAKLDDINNALCKLPAAEPSTSSTTGTTATAPTSTSPPLSSRPTRIDLSEVSELLDGLSEITRELTGIRNQNRAIARSREMATRLGLQLTMSATHPSDLAQRRGSQTHEHGLLDEMNQMLAEVERNLHASTERIERELHQACTITDQLRLVPAAGVFSMLERAVRDASQSTGHAAVFEVSGGDVLLDGQVLDIVSNALVQLVRNAVAHGIESESERMVRGKSPTGRVNLDVARHGYRVSFRCSDDGNGINFDAVRQSAERQGYPLPDPDQLDTQSLLTILLKGGISTADALTQVAGRGIGLDIVREVAQQLNGELHANTTARVGTTVELTVPVSLASIDVLQIEWDGQLASIPLEAVRCTKRLAQQDIVRSADGESILHEGQMIPLLSPRFTERPRRKVKSTAEAISAVVLSAGGTVTAVGVDHLLGIDTVVLRPLPALAIADPVILGSYLSSNGNPCLVLDPKALATGRHTLASLSNAEPASPEPILIIDDSLTTRMLEQSILESAGMTVDVAASAEEGLDMARRKRYALCLVDVEMPGMDGFSFIERTRADPHLCDIPCILVTSCDTDEHRQRGKTVGAIAYIVKSHFDQVAFLDQVHSLVQS